MAQLVYEFGSKNPDAAIEALARSVGSAPHSVELVTEENYFQPSLETLATASQRVQEGQYDGFCVRPVGTDIQCALLSRPSLKDRFSLWRGFVVYSGQDPWRLWRTLTEIDDFLFVSLSLEEGVELEDRQLSPEYFPWEYEALIAAAVRRDDGSRIMAAGCEYKRLAQFPGAPVLETRHGETAVGE